MIREIAKIKTYMQNAFHIPPIYTTIALVAVAAVIVLHKNATVKVLDVIVPIMACGVRSIDVKR